jgi:dihydropteroate synthase
MGAGSWTPNAAVAHGEALVAAGAEIIDVGGESTRPGAQPVTEREELRRVIPVIERLADRVGAHLDRHDEAGSGAARARGGGEPGERCGGESIGRAMWNEVARYEAGYVCMHMRGRPSTMQREPAYADVVGEVNAFFRERLRGWKACGVSPEQVMLDVGIGFGKTVEHNLQLIARAASFKRTKRPTAPRSVAEIFHRKTVRGGGRRRLAGSLACACWAVMAGVQIIRAHDVAETVQAVRMTEIFEQTRWRAWLISCSRTGGRRWRS